MKMTYQTVYTFQINDHNVLTLESQSSMFKNTRMVKKYKIQHKIVHYTKYEQPSHKTEASDDMGGSTCLLLHTLAIWVQYLVRKLHKW